MLHNLNLLLRIFWDLEQLAILDHLKPKLKICEGWTQAELGPRQCDHVFRLKNVVSCIKAISVVTTLFIVMEV